MLVKSLGQVILSCALLASVHALHSAVLRGARTEAHDSKSRESPANRTDHEQMKSHIMQTDLDETAALEAAALATVLPTTAALLTIASVTSKRGSAVHEVALEKPLDERLSKLRRWLDDNLGKMGLFPAAKSWSHDDWTGHSESIEWLTGNACTSEAAPRAENCNQVCGHLGFTCDLASLKSLKNVNQVDQAANASGSRCAENAPIEWNGQWDGPWIDDASKCQFVIRGNWMPSCDAQPVCGFHRLCPCKALPGVTLPSLQRKSMAQWHRQWDHACKSPDVVQKMLQQRIPHHWHFVLIRERAQWINMSTPSQLISANSAEYKKLDSYEQLLIENMRYSLAINKAESVHFLDDAACRHAIERADIRLLAIFDREGDIRYKTDICRIAALYNEGGYYFDDDMHSYNPVSLVIHEDTRFATARGVSGDKEFFQSFLASTPCHPILKRNLEMLVAARMPNAPRRYEGLLGPVTLKLAWDEVQAPHTQLVQEIHYDRLNKSYEPEPFRNGHSCEFAVIDPESKKMLFCSRM